MTSRLRRLAPLLSAAVFAAALWTLHHELKRFHYQDVAAYLRGLPAADVGWALLLTAGSYLLLTVYDLLGFRYAGRPLPFRQVAQGAFIGYSFSNSVGNALFTGAPIRFRLYSGWGVTPEEITKVVAFGFLTFWLGFLSLAGAAFALVPASLPRALHLPFASERPLGIVCLALVVGFLAATLRRPGPIQVRGWEFRLPTPRLAAAQIAVASLDWALAAGVLYALLPPHPALAYPAFLGLFLLAQLAGFLSQIPGGLGVFETVIVLLLAPAVPAASVLGALVAFRVVYYLMPLVAGATLLAAHEARLHRAHFDRAAELMARWMPAAVPQALAATTFAGGVILLFSGATPPLASRFSWLNELLPLPVIEASHFLASLAGVGLLVLARGLQQRLDGAYHLTAGLLAVGVVASLLKGLDYEEALSLLVMLALLLPCRANFDRRASLIRARFTTGWIVAIGLVLVATAFLTVFAFKHVEYSHDLWWRFAIHGHAPRSLRALVGAAALAAGFGTARLLRPAAADPDPPRPADLDRAEAIAAASPRTYGHLALLGDKRLLFDESGTAFVMFAVEGRSWIAMGDPVGPDAAATDLAWRLQEMADRHGGWPVFYQVAEDRLERYAGIGLALLKLGEEAMVPLAAFTLEGRVRKGLRNEMRRIERERCEFELVPRPGVPALMADLAAISGAWLAAKRVQEKGFSLGRFDPAYLARFPVALVRREGRIVAFANVWATAGREELSIDLMRFGAGAPAGVMTFLFVRLMQWGAAEGYRRFSLGVAPLAGLEERGGTPLWRRLAGLVYRHGEHFFNFQGLRLYKEKFEPVWEPRYLASPGGFALPQILTNVTTLISGGVRGVFAK